MQTYEGKAKRVIPIDEDEVQIFYKDDATAFNGEKHEQFEGKGALNSRITELLFDFLHEKGVASHHLGRIDERALRARRVEIIPLEAVVRFKVAGSLKKRTGLDYLHPCEPPIVELYYKRDDLGDPMITEEHVRVLQLASPEECSAIKEKAVLAATHLRDLFEKAGIDLVDLKMEFGRDGADGVLLADEISPDTCRFRDYETGEVLDKDLFRFGGGDLLTGYRKLLDRLERALAAPAS